jgi:hypothetical protein
VRTWTAVAAAGTLLAAPAAFATPQVWTWRAVGVEAAGSAADSLAPAWVGAELAGWLRFDPATPAAVSSDGLSLYLPGPEVSLQLRGADLLLRTARSAGDFLSAADDFSGCTLDVAFPGPCDLLAFSLGAVLEGAGAAVEGTVRLVLADTGAAALGDTRLPAVTPVLGAFDLRRLDFVSTEPGVLRARAELVVLAPEPSTVLLLGSGLAALSRRRRCR